MRIAAVLLAAALGATPVRAQTAVGLEALDFTLDSLDGDVVTLSDFRGQVVMLNFFGYT